MGEDEKTVNMMEWCLSLPKIELHAHLNGSIRDSTLLELAKVLGDKGMLNFSEIEHVIMKNCRSLPECFKLFDLIHILTTDHATVTRITKEVVEDFVAENIVYLELRTTPKKNEAKGMTKRSYIEAVIDGLRAVDTVEVVLVPNDESNDMSILVSPLDDACERTKRSKIYVRLLLSIDRRETTAAAMETVQLALEMRNFGVIGIDLSGNPVVGEWLTLLPALQWAKEHGLPITLHCGEVPNQKEVQAMLEFAPQRIGHACCFEEEEWRKLKSSKIPVEICLSSNVRTGCVHSIDDHHFGLDSFILCQISYFSPFCCIVFCSEVFADIGKFDNAFLHNHLSGDIQSGTKTKFLCEIYSATIIGQELVGYGIKNDLMIYNSH